MHEITFWYCGNANLRKMLYSCTVSHRFMYHHLFLTEQQIGIGYNSVWSVLCECNEHNTRQTVL